MVNDAWTVFGPYLGLFAIGPLSEIVLRAARPRQRGDGLPVAGLAGGLLLALMAWLFKVWLLHPMAQAAGSATGGTDAMGAYNLVMSIIGFVISVLTGLAVAAAWRAVDEANRATETVRKLTSDHEFDLRRIAAYAEAVHNSLRARSVPELEHRWQPLAELVALFSLQTPREIAEKAAVFVVNGKVFSGMGPEGVALFSVVSQHPTVRRDLQLVAHRAIAQSHRTEQTE